MNAEFGEFDGGNGLWASITAANAVSVPGDTIRVHGLTLLGAPYGYCENIHPSNRNPGVQGEFFPIVLKDGVTLERELSVAAPVYIWTINSGTGDMLIQIPGSSAPSPTTIRDISLVGADYGIYGKFEGGVTTWLELDTVRFIRNRIGVYLEASDGSDLGIVSDTSIRTLRIADCVIAYGGYSGPLAPPSFRPPSRGLEFYAQQPTSPSGLGQPGRIWAEISNLSTAGIFDQIEADAVIVKARVLGKSDEQQGGGPHPISTVKIDFLGCELDGQAAPPGTNLGWGWAVGIDGEIERPGMPSYPIPWNYQAACDLDLSGVVVRKCRETGIHILSSPYGRGHLTLLGNSKVELTGIQKSPGAPLSKSEGAGIFVEGGEGYVSLEMWNAEIKNNWGNGISVLSGGLIVEPANTAVHWGSYLGLRNSRISRNGGHGLALYGEGDGCVGGTWSFPGGVKKLVYGLPVTVNAMSPFDILWGQGVVDRCSISNNGWGAAWNPQYGQGVLVSMNGGGIAANNIASLKFTNSMIWHNSGGGFFVEDRGFGLGYCLTPLIHCTLVGNGDPTGSQRCNVDVGGPWTGAIDFMWEEINSGSSDYLATKILDSILQREDPQANDFGPGMSPPTRLYFLDANGTDHDLVYVKGLRCLENYNELKAEWWTRLAAPFTGGNLWSDDKTQFYLDLNGANMYGFQETPHYYFRIDEPSEVFQDIQPYTRPPLVAASGTTSDRDKGAHQTPW